LIWADRERSCFFCHSGVFEERRGSGRYSELKFIEDSTNLDTEGRFLVVAVEPICNGHDANAFEVELREDREHQVVVASESGEIIDENQVELTPLRGREQRGEAVSIAPRSRLRLVPVDVVVENG
jgi:hypothetical protein